MTEISFQHFEESMAGHIRRNRKTRTILFTDIKNSTKIWDDLGDVQGRLIVDRHNCLLFPIIRKYKGRVIKTIGDSIMASFKNPNHAVRAAVVMQQALDKERKSNKNFSLQIRIGIHSGQAIVERQDIYGDVVNIAARVSAKARGNQILLSEATLDTLRRTPFDFEKGKSFIPKGKKTLINTFICDWKQAKVTMPPKAFSYSPLTKGQKKEIALFSVASMIMTATLYHLYLRFFLNEVQEISILTLFPSLLWEKYWYISIGIGFIAAYSAVKLYRNFYSPLRFFRLLKGGAGFQFGFTAIYLIGTTLPASWVPKLTEVQYESRRTFVETKAAENKIYKKPTVSSKQLHEISSGKLLLLSETKKKNSITWYKIFLGNNKYGWVPHVTPAKIGLAEKLMSSRNRFFVYNLDLLSLLVGCIGFFWGALSFRIRPI